MPLALALLAGALAAAPSAGAAAGADASALRAPCRSVLAGAGKSHYSRAELLMICRSRLPSEVCRGAALELGERPWSSATMDRACGKWEEQHAHRMLIAAPERREQALEDWVAQVDDVMKQKTAVGACTNETVDACVAYKREGTSNYTRQLNDAMAEKHASSGAPRVEEPAVASEDPLLERDGLVLQGGPLLVAPEVQSLRALGGGPGKPLTTGAAAATGAAVSGGLAAAAVCAALLALAAHLRARGWRLAAAPAAEALARAEPEGPGSCSD